MIKLINCLKNAKDVTMIEYGLIAVLIAVVVIAAVTLTRADVQSIFSSLSAAL